MNDKPFEELLESVKQGGEILKGTREAKRIFNFSEPDVKPIREHYSLSQAKFSKLLGISPTTLRNWEQGRRKPEGPARILLCVAAKHPKAVLDTLYNA